MSIPVLLFASYADAFGARQVDAPLDAPCSVRDLVASMRALPGGHVLPTNPLVAVNHEWVHEHVAIAVGDEVGDPAGGRWLSTSRSSTAQSTSAD